ncbi:protein disulfide isomerase 2 [Trypanosoma cruzi]|uniref:Protein disulfide isomerase 2 n=1 Tax=Trypanosoma cruzi TaxID=5693 RepID=A0A2V2WFA0_TRYCR|nr:protein disulfide isomerase 2 [Trypanosoma cruzi]
MRRLMVLLWVDAEQYGVASSLGLSDDAKYPAFVIARGEDHFVHPSTEPVTAESIENLFIEYSEKKLFQKIKSQPVPEIETVEGLTTVVGKTLDKYLSSGKDMLIEFFAPWCGHCKNLAPIYAKVAKEFESSDVIIAAMDATANQVDNSLLTFLVFRPYTLFPMEESQLCMMGAVRSMKFTSLFMSTAQL